MTILFGDTRYRTLGEALNACNSEVLLELARLFRKKVPTKKADRVSVILDELAGEGLRSFWSRLDPTMQLAVQEATHHHDGRFSEDRFKAKYGQLPLRYSSGYGSVNTRVPYTLFDVLLVSDRLPCDIQERLKLFVPPPPAPKIATVERLPDSVSLPLPGWRRKQGVTATRPLTIAETERSALHDMKAVLRLIDAGRVSVSEATKRVTSAGAKALAAVLREGDFATDASGEKAADTIRPFALSLIAQAAGLAKASGGKLALSRAGKAALAQPAHEVIKSAWEDWQSNKLLDEFNRIDEIKGQNRKGRGALSPASIRRGALRDTLSKCPVGEWIAIDEFFRFIVAAGHNFIVSRGGWGLYIGHPEYGHLSESNFTTWKLIQGRYAMCLLWEYVATLGLVDIAHIPAEDARDDFRSYWGTDDLSALSRYDGLLYFRITALGAWCLGMANDYETAPIAEKAALRILPNHEIVVIDLENFEAGDALFLDRIAVKVHERAWRLDQSRILEAIEAGFQPHEIGEFLAARSDDEIPGGIVHLIDGIVERASHIQYHGAAEIFRAHDEPTALLILHDSAMKSLCFGAHGDRIVVPAENIAPFRRALRKLGYALPPGGDKNRGRNSLKMEDDE